MSGKKLAPVKFMELAQTTQYTVPPGTTTLLDGLEVVNATAAAATFSARIVNSGDTLGPEHILVPTTSVPANSKVTVLSGKWINAGDSVSTIASAASTITMHLGGREFP